MDRKRPVKQFRQQCVENQANNTERQPPEWNFPLLRAQVETHERTKYQISQKTREANEQQDQQSCNCGGHESHFCGDSASYAT